MDSPSNDAPCGYLCTHAITGSTHPAYQSIYVCETCRLSADDGRDELDARAFCICECCAEVCHADHNVEFVGMGPCTCDCSLLCSADVAEESSAEQMGDGREVKSAAARHQVCKLVEVSQDEASRLGFEDGSRMLNAPIPITVPSVRNLLPSERDPDDLNSDDASYSEPSSEWTTPQCIECNSTMKGYTIGSFTISSLSSNQGFEQCQNLIRQAETLVQESRDTFWVPIGDNGEAMDNGEQLSDLELLAKDIYLRHIKAYNLNTQNPGNNLNQKSLNVKRSDNEASISGAEWWVQVKPAGSTKTPVDLHYDKDEALAESFCIGSFPTLSTVTYLTGESANNTQYKDDGESKGGMDTVPTVVFPHTYHDDEDQPISSMLLSRPVRGKHLVFDGRLLHGAPGHPALRFSRSDASAARSDDISPLRVTFLVNIWRTGRPAGVQILPSEIRTKIQSSAGSREKSLYGSSLEFEKRPVPQYVAPSKLSIAFSAEVPLDTQIILPFVSKGATWISDDEAEDTADKMDSSEDLKSTMMKGDANEDGFGSDNNEEEEDDDLFLCLPQFASSEYLDDEADTAVFLFQTDNQARLVR
ncbi:hypothetical protein ACHAXN_001831 [Cyclotella atomus]